MQKQVDSSRAAFRRNFASNLVGFRDAASQSPGASIHWRTNAERVTAVLQYSGTGNQCSESCAINTGTGQCYSDRCHARCAVLLYIDGQLQEAATHHADGTYRDVVRVVAMMQPHMRVHQYEVVLPWNAVVDLISIELSSAGQTMPELMPTP
eukprot:2079200-Prymnesium_polylepis.1